MAITISGVLELQKIESNERPNPLATSALHDPLLVDSERFIIGADDVAEEHEPATLKTEKTNEESDWLLYSPPSEGSTLWGCREGRKCASDDCA